MNKKPSTPSNASVTSLIAPPYRITKEGVELFVRGSANASKTRIQGTMIDAGGRTYLKVYVAAPAESGKANAEIIETLAKYFDLPKSCISQSSGFSSRFKIFLLDGISVEEVITILASQYKCQDI